MPAPDVDHPHGIATIDSGFIRPRLDAIHLIVERDRVAVVDTGTNDSIPRVFAALAARGLGPAAIDYVLLTHVHLDHAGGAGLLMSQAPNATLVVHPRGVRHMVDPSRLMAATRDVYGADAATAMYGEIVPVPVGRIVETHDGSTVDLAGRTLTFHDTAGHARHHNCIHDARSGELFAGDMFGLSYRELDRDGRQFAFPATTPTQFDPDAFHDSIDRMLALRPAAVYMTHYGRVVDVARIAADLLRLVDAHADLGRRCAAIADRSERREALRRGVRAMAVDEAVRQPWGIAPDAVDTVFAMDIELNADGLESWIAGGGAATPSMRAAA